MFLTKIKGLLRSVDHFNSLIKRKLLYQTVNQLMHKD